MTEYNRRFPRDTEIPDIAEVCNIGRQGFIALAKNEVETLLIDGKDLTDYDEATLTTNLRKMMLKQLSEELEYKAYWVHKES